MWYGGDVTTRSIRPRRPEALVVAVALGSQRIIAWVLLECSATLRDYSQPKTIHRLVDTMCPRLSKDLTLHKPHDDV